MSRAHSKISFGNIRCSDQTLLFTLVLLAVDRSRFQHILDLVLQEVIAILRQLLPHFGKEILEIFKIKYNTCQVSGIFFLVEFKSFYKCFMRQICLLEG